MEQVLGEIAGVKHIYSTSRPGLAMLTIQFEVGEPRTEAIVRLYNAIYSNQDWRPANLGVLQPLVRPGGIDDVPILALTLWTRDPDAARGIWAGRAFDRNRDQARAGHARCLHDRQPGERRARATRRAAARGHGLTVGRRRRRAAGRQPRAPGGRDHRRRSRRAGAGRRVPRRSRRRRRARGRRAGRQAGLSRGRRRRRAAAEQPVSYVTHGTGAAVRGAAAVAQAPAVTIAVSKKPGENAIDVASQVLDRIAMLEGSHVPEGVEVTVTRNYGVTADDKAKKLIQKLLFATASVVLLVVLAMGRREALVVGAAVIVTLAATLFASWAWGFTINRVSLFALIFSIGILVDDAIVIVENIHRRMALERAPLAELIPRAVDEVGGPTILATFTVIAALLPMAFVSGLMGPYMSPIPINSSMGMLISLASRWCSRPGCAGACWAGRSRGHAKAGAAAHGADPDGADPRPRELFERVVRPFLASNDGRARRHKLYWGILAAIVIAVSLAVVQLVVLKMLPFDNKSEFQVVLNMPEGTPVEQTAAVLDELAAVVRELPEVTTSRAMPERRRRSTSTGSCASTTCARVRSSATCRSTSSTSTSAIARATKSHWPCVRRWPRSAGAMAPPCRWSKCRPARPVLAPLVAEVYGPDPTPSAAARRCGTAQAVRRDAGHRRYRRQPRGAKRALCVWSIDREKAARLGVSRSSRSSKRWPPR
jgi:multidrug efflux pump subunit AcrB